MTANEALKQMEDHLDYQLLKAKSLEFGGLEYGHGIVVGSIHTYESALKKLRELKAEVNDE